MTRLIATGLAVAAALSGAAAAAAPLLYSHAQPDAPTEGWGTGKAETMDVAVSVTEPAFKGAKVTAIEMQLAPGANVNGCTGWLSEELLLDGKNFTPDLVSASVEVQDQTLRLVLDNPVEVGKRGLYAGFSFTLDDIDTSGDKAPVMCAEAVSGGGLWVHSTRTYRAWSDLSAATGRTCAMTVTLEGGFDSANVAAQPGTAFGTPGSTLAVPLHLTNYGTGGISSITYTYSFGDEGGTGQTTLEAPVPGYWGAECDVTVPVTAPSAQGTYSMEIAVTSVDGTPNARTDAAGTTSVEILGFLPERLPLVEEFTGTWCGYCPKGHIMLERMHAMYGDRFVALSYHQASGHRKEVMECVPELPYEIESFPAAVLDRTYLCDPYYAGTSTFGMPAKWEMLTAGFTPVGITLDIDWDGSEDGRVTLTSTVQAAKDLDARRLAVAYVLAGDGYTGPSDPTEKGYSDWLQQNNYEGWEELLDEGDDWATFVNGPQLVAGLVFNDVVLAATDWTGVTGSLPAQMEAGHTYTHSVTFEAGDLQNIHGNTMLRPGVSLHGVAVVIDNGYHSVSLNCAKSAGVAYDNTGSVHTLSADGTGEQAWDLMGRPVTGAYRGIAVVRGADGRCRKVVR